MGSTAAQLWPVTRPLALHLQDPKLYNSPRICSRTASNGPPIMASDALAQPTIRPIHVSYSQCPSAVLVAF